jgi:hypothetical protein
VKRAIVIGGRTSPTVSSSGDYKKKRLDGASSGALGSSWLGAARQRRIALPTRILPAEAFELLFEGRLMKLAGFLLLLAGWGIVVSTLPLLPSLTMRAAFVLAGMAVELVGLGLVVRSHLVPKG